MSHLQKDKTRLLARVRRLKGQIEAIERALESDADCGAVLNLVASVRGATAGLMGELIEDHLQAHVLEAETAAQREAGAAEMIAAIRTYLK